MDSIDKKEASITEEHFFYRATKSLMCTGKDLLLFNIQQCQRFHFQTTSERPLMTECFCQKSNLGDLGGEDKVKDYCSTTLTPGIHYIVQSLWAI